MLGYHAIVPDHTTLERRKDAGITTLASYHAPQKLSL